MPSTPSVCSASFTWSNRFGLMIASNFVIWNAPFFPGSDFVWSLDARSGVLDILPDGGEFAEKAPGAMNQCRTPSAGCYFSTEVRPLGDPSAVMTYSG